MFGTILLQLIASIIIPKKHHKFMLESESYRQKMFNKYEKQIDQLIKQLTMRNI